MAHRVSTELARPEKDIKAGRYSLMVLGLNTARRSGYEVNREQATGLDCGTSLRTRLPVQSTRHRTGPASLTGPWLGTLAVD